MKPEEWFGYGIPLTWAAYFLWIAVFSAYLISYFLIGQRLIELFGQEEVEQQRQHASDEEGEEGGGEGIVEREFHPGWVPTPPVPNRE